MKIFERHLIASLAGLNFLTFAVRGLTIPFVSLYFASVSFSGTEIGLVIGVSALVQLATTPLTHMLADRTGRHRRLFYGMQVGHILSSFGLVLSANKIWLGAANVLRESTSLPGMSLLSQLTINRLDEPRRHVYGRIRAWGSLGWAAATIASGGIIALGGYPLLYILAGAVNLLLLPIVSIFPARSAVEMPPAAARAAAPRPAVFYVLVFSAGLFFVAMNATNVFGILYFKRDLGATDAFIGLAVAITALSEIPSMLIFERVAKRINLRALMVIGMAGQACFFMSLSALADAAPIIPLMMLRGTFYTFHLLSMVLLVARISHPMNAATNQALVQVTAPGLAVLLSGPVNGWVFDHLGPRALLLSAGLLALAAAGLVFAIRGQMARREEAMEAIRSMRVVHG